MNWGLVVLFCILRYYMAKIERYYTKNEWKWIKRSLQCVATTRSSGSQVRSSQCVVGSCPTRCDKQNAYNVKMKVTARCHLLPNALWEVVLIKRGWRRFGNLSPNALLKTETQSIGYDACKAVCISCPRRCEVGNRTREREREHDFYKERRTCTS